MISQAAKRADTFISSVPAHPFLFAFYPIARLYQENMFQVDSGDIVLPTLVALGLTAVGLAVLALLLRDVRRAAIIVSAVVLPVMLFGLVYDLLSPLLTASRWPFLGASLAFVVVATIVALRVRQSLGQITMGLNVISLLLVAVAVIPVATTVSAEFSRDLRSARTAGSPTGRVASSLTTPASAAGTTRDIYHLVLDRYGSETSLEHGFGIDNTEFLAWLREHGFQVIGDAHANYTKTTLSLGATLSMEPLDDVVADRGPDSENLSPVVRRIKNSNAGRFLQERGYKYVHIGSWFNQTRDSRIADVTYNPETELSFNSTLYETTILPVLVNQPEPTVDFARKHADSAIYQFDLLNALAAQHSGPKYVFAHILLPHPPYVFLADGRFRPNKATFETQIADTNRRVEAFLEPLLALPEDEQPIIILQADEGPFPERFADNEDGFDWSTATDDEVLTKFGVFDAMYLPGPQGAAPLPQDLTLINTYPEVLRRYFGVDLPDQPDRVLASNRSRPYAMLDITNRIKDIEDRLGLSATQ